jgi:hypothetical protein
MQNGLRDQTSFEQNILRIKYPHEQNILGEKISSGRKTS